MNGIYLKPKINCYAIQVNIIVLCSDVMSDDWLAFRAVGALGWLLFAPVGMKGDGEHGELIAPENKQPVDH